MPKAGINGWDTWSAVITRDHVYNKIVNITARTEAEYKSVFVATKHTPYLALTGELWGVFCENFVENWSRNNGTALYLLLG